MKSNACLMFAILLATAIPIANARAELKITPEKENVVASRLIGSWEMDAKLTIRLRGELSRSGGESLRLRTFIFKSDASIVEKIPERYEKFLSEKRIYLAGIMSGAGTEYPFILIEHNGNPHLVYFRERDGDPLGDGESFNLFIARAKETKNDLLFIGGDFNNQPFDAYHRAE